MIRSHHSARPLVGWLALLVALPLAGACGRTSESSRAADSVDAAASDTWSDGGSMSMAERTHAMEEKAAEIEARQRELMESGASEEELMRAAQELEAERQELNDMGDDAGDGY